MNAKSTLDMVHNNTYIIDGKEYRGRYVNPKDVVHILCDKSVPPELKPGMLITEVVGNSSSSLIITKIGQLLDLDNARQYPGKVILEFSCITEAEHQRLSSGNNHPTSGSSSNITITELIEHIKNSDDEEAKSTLRQLLYNPTVGELIGSDAETYAMSLVA